MKWARYTNVDSMYTPVDSVTRTNYAMCAQTLSHLPAYALQYLWRYPQTLTFHVYGVQWDGYWETKKLFRAWAI